MKKIKVGNVVWLTVAMLAYGWLCGEVRMHVAMSEIETYANRELAVAQARSGLNQSAANLQAKGSQ